MAQEREKIIQIAINSKDEIIALTNHGNILKKGATGTVWSDVAKPERVDYAKKIESAKTNVISKQ